jgi:hypothetical protein
MKLVTAVCLACAFAPLAANAQSQSQPPAPASVQAQPDQPQSGAKHHFLRNTQPTMATDTCVGPVSYCTIFFGS